MLELAGASLYTIRLKLHDSHKSLAPEVDNMMRGLASASPNIHCLTLSRDHQALPLGKPLLAVTLQWTHLRDVRLYSISATNELINAFSSLTYLRTLRLRSCLRNTFTNRYHSASLPDVELAHCDLNTRTTFLSSLDSPRLRSVEISPPVRSRWSRDRFIEVVCALSKNPNLEEICITKSGRGL